MRQTLNVRLLTRSVRMGILAAVMVIAAGAYVQRAHAAAAHTAPVAHGAHTHMTMDQAVRMVERRYHARVVRAETHKKDGRTVYVLRLLDRSGRVFTVRVDAANGRIV